MTVAPLNEKVSRLIQYINTAFAIEAEADC